MSAVEHEVVKRPGFDVLVLRIGVPDLALPGAIMDVRSQMFALVEREEAQLVVVDFSRVARATTDGFAILLGIQKRLKSANAAVRVVGLNAALMASYELCMLQRIVPASATLEQAIESYEKEMASG